MTTCHQFTRHVFLRSWIVTLLSVLNRTKALDTNWRWEKHKKRGLNCVGFFFFFSYWSHWWEAVRVHLLTDVQILNAADKNRERERERRETQSNYTGSFHKPEVVLSPLHFQGDFTNNVISNYKYSSTQARDFQCSSTQPRDFPML